MTLSRHLLPYSWTASPYFLLHLRPPNYTSFLSTSWLAGLIPQISMSSVRLGRPASRNNVVGLPSSPRARSVGRYEIRRENERDRGRGREYYSYRGTPALAPTPNARSRSVQPNRPMASLMPLPRGGPSSYMDRRDAPPLPRQRLSAVSPQSSATSESFSSASGSSTFLDRMRGRGGYVSSRTSMEDEPEPRKEMRYERGGDLRQRRAAVLPEPETGALKGRPILGLVFVCSCLN